MLVQAAPDGRGCGPGDSSRIASAVAAMIGSGDEQRENGDGDVKSALEHGRDSDWRIVAHVDERDARHGVHPHTREAQVEEVWDELDRYAGMLTLRDRSAICACEAAGRAMINSSTAARRPGGRSRQSCQETRSGRSVAASRRALRYSRAGGNRGHGGRPCSA